MEAGLFLPATPALKVRALSRMNKEDKPRSGVSVPGHALRCGPETSVTGPLRWRWVELRAHEKTYIQSSRPWECGNPEGISTECGKGGSRLHGFPPFPYSVISMACFSRGKCWINRYAATQCNMPHSPRDAHRVPETSSFASAITVEGTTASL
jgi:hypothetical protein